MGDDNIFLISGKHISEKGKDAEKLERDGKRNKIVRAIKILEIVIYPFVVVLLVWLILTLSEESILIHNTYYVVIDAGSTGTRLFVYKTKAEGKNNAALCEMRGMSSYLNNPKMLSYRLQRCLQKAEATIPHSEISATPIYFLATAGMRLLSEANKTASDAILIVVRDIIKRFSFKFTDPEKQARIITGAEEGMYSFVAINSLTGGFRKDKEGNMTGTLDMGGASSQITFYPGSDTTLHYSRHLSLFGRRYPFYTHSYTCYGAITAIDQYRVLLVKKQNYRTKIHNPCEPRGIVTYHNHRKLFNKPCTMDSRYMQDHRSYQNKSYKFVGGGNNRACHSQVQELFDFGAPCPWGDKCSFNGTYQPDVFGKFYATGGFYDLLHFMNLTESDKVDVNVFAKKLKKLCSSLWEEVKDMKTSHKSMLPEYCFSGHYMMALLNKAYKFKDWSNISFVRKVGGRDVNWTYGFMVDLNGDLK